jgi:hypothetical protein
MLLKKPRLIGYIKFIPPAILLGRLPVGKYLTVFYQVIVALNAPLALSYAGFVPYFQLKPRQNQFPFPNGSIQRHPSGHTFGR